MLAAAPITWGVCELPGWGLELPYRRVLDEMAAAGFRGMELGPSGYLPADPATLRRELGSRGLTLVGGFCPLTLHVPEQVNESLRAGEALAQLLSEIESHVPLRSAGGLKSAVSSPQSRRGTRDSLWARAVLVAADAGDDRRRAIAGRVTPGEGLDAGAWTRVGEGLATLARRCAPLGVGVVFHPHAGTYVETAAEVETLLDHTPADLVGLCLDTGHLVYGGADPVAVCRKHVARVRHVHAKDVRRTVLDRVRHGEVDYLTAVGQGIFAPLGDGVVDFPGLVDVLRGAGYQGWYVLEQDVRLGDPWPPQDPQANAQRSASYLGRLLEAG